MAGENPKPSIKRKGEREMARKKSTSAKKKDETKEPTTTLEVVTKDSKKGKGAEKEPQVKGSTKSTETPPAPKEIVAKDSKKDKAEAKPTKLTRIESTVQAFFSMSGKAEVNKKSLAAQANKLYAESGGADNEKEALWASGYMLAFEDALKKYNHTLG
jgi:hypothetical protein